MLVFIFQRVWDVIDSILFIYQPPMADKQHQYDWLQLFTVSLHVYVRVCVCACMHACIGYMYACMHVCSYTRRYLGTYVHAYVAMYVCAMHVCICMYVLLQLLIS